MPQGIRGRIGILREKAWGERNGDGDNEAFLPFVSEGLTTNIEELMSAAQRGILDEPKSYQGARSFGGPLVVEAHPITIGHILRSALDLPSEATKAVTTETELENCNAAWVGDDSIISDIDTTDKKKGTASVKLLVPKGVAENTILATKDFDAVNMSSDTGIKFWIKSSIAMIKTDLKFIISEYAKCDETTGKEHREEEISILVEGEWTEVTIPLTGMTNYTEVISIGIRLINAKNEFILRIDDVRRVVLGTVDNAKQHIFTPMQLATEEFSTSCPLYSYTLEVFPDQGKAFRFVGAVVNTLGLNFSASDKILKATCGIIAKDASLQDKIGTLSLPTTKPFVWEDATILVGGGPPASGAMNDLESFGLAFDNKCIAKYLLNNSPVPAKIVRDGFRTIDVSFVIDFVDKTEYAYFLTGEERAFQIKFAGAVCDDPVKYTLQIDLPKVRYLAYPINMGGPERLTCAVTAKAKYYAYAGFNYALQATLINLKDTAEYNAVT